MFLIDLDNVDASDYNFLKSTSLHYMSNDVQVYIYIGGEYVIGTIVPRYITKVIDNEPFYAIDDVIHVKLRQDTSIVHVKVSDLYKMVNEQYVPIVEHRLRVYDDYVGYYTNAFNTNVKMNGSLIIKPFNRNAGLYIIDKPKNMTCATDEIRKSIIGVDTLDFYDAMEIGAEMIQFRLMNNHTLKLYLKDKYNEIY